VFVIALNMGRLTRGSAAATAERMNALEASALAATGRYTRTRNVNVDVNASMLFVHKLY
jgi:hypothetical protein